ncbi:(S)-benzoin forming benzil reductase [Halobacillus kuroshimensis]|uniref:(S)-benzoin forming benzil reductase n=1 Tax=Halobacillus kuroshimensis TaxID=302481 RepID=A0ABS3E0X3_9BACI|nr:(S)-benzoin forming benzil reductase [Halobacillus kuroshimensis]MBN8237226.1 (S)-benzoin forming benzil reductase [Halobacillus kuroshimensis]
MKYAVITGTSRGLGEAVAEKFMKQGVHVLGISRSGNAKLDALNGEKAGSFEHIEADLNDPADLKNVAAVVKEKVFHEQSEYVYVVNNAGVVEPIETAGNLDAEAVQKHMQINVTAPILLINELLPAASEASVKLGIVMVTSGAAEKSIHGWSVYSSSKAALNRFTETLALEQEGSGHTILAFSPGVMDTDMQQEIRSSSESAFADVDKFKKMKEENVLRSPEEVAEVLMNLLDQEITNGQVYRLYDLVN